MEFLSFYTSQIIRAETWVKEYFRISGTHPTQCLCYLVVKILPITCGTNKLWPLSQNTNAQIYQDTEIVGILTFYFFPIFVSGVFSLKTKYSLPFSPSDLNSVRISYQQPKYRKLLHFITLITCQRRSWWPCGLGMVLQPSDFWDCWFEFRWGHECSSLVFVVCFADSSFCERLINRTEECCWE